MARYFAINSLAGAIRNSVASVSEGSTAGRFNSSYVGSYINVGGGGASAPESAIIGAPFIDGSSSISNLWLRSDVYSDFAGVNSLWIRFSSGGVVNYQIKITSTGGGAQMQYWNGSAFVNWGSGFTIPVASLYTLTVHITCGTSFEVFLDGVLAASSVTTPTGASASIDAVLLSNSQTTGNTYYSQVMGADYDIRNAHMFSKLANANGFYTAGTGTFTDINEQPLNDASAIALPATGNAKTFTKAAVPSLLAGLIIAGAVVNARGRVGGGTVTDGKIRIRNGSTDSDSGTKSYNLGIEPRGHFFANDPATGAAWASASAFDSAEFGVLAA